MQKKDNEYFFMVILSCHTHGLCIGPEYDRRQIQNGMNMPPEWSKAPAAA